MAADASLTVLARVVRRALLLVAPAAVVVLALVCGDAGAATPPMQREVAQATAVDALHRDHLLAAGGRPQAAATPSPSAPASKSKKKKSGSSGLVLLVLIGIGLVVYLTARKRKTASGGVLPAGGGLFGGGLRGPPPHPREERLDAVPDPPPTDAPPATPPTRAQGRPRPKRRGR